MKTFITLLFLLLISNLYGQIIGSEYSKVKTIERSKSTHEKIAFDFILDTEKDLLAIGFDFKPANFEVYRLSDWQLIQTFQVKGFISENQSYFSDDGAFLYIKKSRVNTVYKIDLAKGHVHRLKWNKLQDDCDCVVENSPYTKYWKQTLPMDEYFYFGDYLLEVTDSMINVYKK